ncbi:TadE/TadG family type IV pilus assembly protein [Microbacterium sp. MYb62]|uniref:TadE/TadG family type IV pilus assembly protein n=1 Tax=Microbacterium sp. MYb62 TaxID=1848690 RepID=UPI000CFB47A7|nr:TadE/TadG family type IV pilus assembly protein [Microbacterium sp. MYb62]PRB10400.1 TadE family protein [Microbacterium sp. MYb62]
MRERHRLTDDRGSSPVEFLLVGTLLTALTLAVLQLAFAVYVRNVVHDAAVEGAYRAALADTTLEEGIERTRDVIARAVGGAYAEDISAGVSGTPPDETVEVRVRTTFPLLGLIGVPFAMEVEAHAPAETFGDR